MKMSLNKTIQEAQEKHDALVAKQSKEFEEFMLEQQKAIEKKQEELISKEKESIEEMNTTIQKAIDDADKKLLKETNVEDIDVTVIKKMKEPELVEYANSLGIDAKVSDSKPSTLKKVLTFLGL